jgi:arylsulfatase A-like enzyme
VAAVAGSASCGHKPSPAPSVILVSVDTLRADRLNLYGYRRHSVSANLDSLARDGIVFENTISASPWTMPSHFSMLTGHYPSSHGMMFSFGELLQGMREGSGVPSLPESIPTLAQLLHASGFATAAFTGGGPVDPKLGFGRGFERYDTSMFKLNRSNMDRLLTWVRNRRQGGFFLFWHHFEVHAPYLHTDFLPELLPRERVDALSSFMGTLSATLAGEDPMGEAVSRYHAQFGAKLTENGADARAVSEALYVAGVKAADAYLGELVSALRDSGLYDSTLLVVTSDHGEELGYRFPEAFYNEHGFTLYDEMIRVPLILKLPSQSHAGTRVRALSRTVDIMPTILDLLDLEAPKGLEGMSLRPVWERRDTPPRLAYSEALAHPGERKSVRSDRHKYVVSMSPETVTQHGRRHVPDRPFLRELYDLILDPGERKNLLQLEQARPLDPERRLELLALATRLEGILRRHAASRTPEARPVQLEQETLQRLQALGYVDP